MCFGRASLRIVTSTALSDDLKHLNWHTHAHTHIGHKTIINIYKSESSDCCWVGRRRSNSIKRRVSSWTDLNRAETKTKRGWRQDKTTAIYGIYYRLRIPIHTVLGSLYLFLSLFLCYSSIVVSCFFPLDLGLIANWRPFGPLLL